jgi:hypothetical protein
MTLPLSFGILEHNDGVALQIIYSGNPETSVSVTGTIVGAGQPRSLAPDEKSFESHARGKMRKTQIGVGMILLIISGFIFGWFIDNSLSANPRRVRPSREKALTLIVVGVALAAGGWYVSDRALPPNVPQSIWLKQ